MQLNYLESLVHDKESLISVLRGNGVMCLDSDTFTTLIPKIDYMRGIGISDFTYLFSNDMHLDNKGLQNNCSLKPSTIFSMFYNSKTLTTDIFKNNNLFSNLDLTDCTQLGRVFNSCTKLTELDLSKWKFDSNKIYTTNAMFYNTSLKTINIGNSIINTNNSKEMFSYCPITDIISEGGKIICSGDATNMFYYSRYITKIPDCIEFKGVTNLSQAFYNCSSLDLLNMTNWDVSKLKSMGSFVNGCSKLTTIIMDNLHFDTLESSSYNFNNATVLTKIDMQNVKLPNLTSFNNFFANASALTDLNITGIYTPNAKSFYQMFYNCKSLENIDLRELPMSQATSVSNIFGNCTNLKDVKMYLNGICKTNNGAFDSVFYNLPNLETVNTEDWDYDFKIVRHFFRNCPKITRLDLSGITISYIRTYNGNLYQDSSYWFYDCPALTFVNISKIDFTVATFSTQTWFGGTTPQDCEIIVKDEASKAALLAKKTTLTNVKTKEEYENEQSTN